MSRARGLAVALSAMAAMAGCGQDTGSPGGGADVSRVSGTAAGQDFSFGASSTGASFAASDPNAGDLTIHLCEAGCPELGGSAPTDRATRVLTLTVTGATADVRSGSTFPIGNTASAVAIVHGPSGDTNDSASGGEVVIDSTDLRQGGHTVGSFQLQMDSGGSLSGFFDAQISSLTGPVVVLGLQKTAP